MCRHDIAQISVRTATELERQRSIRSELEFALESPPIDFEAMMRIALSNETTRERVRSELARMSVEGLIKWDGAGYVLRAKQSEVS